VRPLEQRPRPLEERLRSHLAELERDGLLRQRRPPQGIDLSSNDYLGLATHPLIKERMAAAVCAMGAGSTGSRLLRGERDAFTELEQRFAEFKGTDRALYFGSGYLANLAVLTTFPEAGDTIFSDEWNHASFRNSRRTDQHENSEGSRHDQDRRYQYPKQILCGCNWQCSDRWIVLCGAGV